MSEGRGFERLATACAAVRARVLLASVAGVIGGAALVLLLLSFLPAPLREGRGSPVPLIFFAGILGGALAGGWLVVRGIRSVRPELVADEVDVGAGLGTGDVRGALELGMSGASARPTGLAALHRARVDERLSTLPPDRLLPRTAPRWSRRLRQGVWTVGLALAALGLSALARPRPTLSAARALSAPWRTAFPAPLPALEIRGASGAPRGRALEVEIVAPGRRHVLLAARPAGEATARRELEIPPSGETTAGVGPIDTPTWVWIEDVGGATSDTLLVRPLEPLLVQDLRVQVEFPAYLGREGESYRGQVPVLVVPEGTTLYVSGETNLPLDEGRLGAAVEDAGSSRTREVPSDEVELRVDGRRFGASWVPHR
ncbi:MAG: hypothetical protein R3266_08480, partial [Gemmatimonadota bacterium]|nr:hypothetical protein [Gemmatimonadota bacterium]